MRPPKTRTSRNAREATEDADLHEKRMRKGLLCLVTDRRRLAERLGRPESDALALLAQQLEGAIRGGIDIVQIRERDLDARPLVQLVRDALRLADGTATRVIVNERIDVALAADAHGVHLREASMSARLVKDHWPSLMVGRSAHSRDAMRRETGVDYWIAGTVYPTASKPSAECLGVDGLREIVGASGAIPVIAIGGITATTLPHVARAGAAGVAAIGAFLPAEGLGGVVESVEKTVRTLRFAFDSASTVP